MTPHVSARRNGSGLSKSSFNRITKNHLRWHPYQINIRHALREDDFRRRLQFSNWFIERCRDFRFLANLLISDEANFQTNGEVNTLNIRQYVPSGNVPPFNYDRNVSREKVVVWAGMRGNGELIGPFSIEGNLNGIGYYNPLIERVFPSLMEHFGDQFDNDHFRRLWWARNGAPPRTLVIVRNLLVEIFQNRVIALHHDPEWPARSPDLTPCDFFLWGYMKNKVFSTPPATVEVIRERIQQEFGELRRNRAMVRRAVRHMEKRATLCIERWLTRRTKHLNI